MGQITVFQTSIALALFLQLIGLCLAVGSDEYLDKKQRRLLFINIGLAFALIIQNYGEELIAQGEPHKYLRTSLAVAGYIIRPLIIVLFCHIVEPKKNYKVCWALVIINAVIHMTSYFCRLCFVITGDNHYVGGPLKDLCFVVSMLLLLYLLILTIQKYKQNGLHDMLIPLMIVAAIVASAIMDANIHSERQPIEYLTIAMVTCCVFYYIWLHLQFVRAHERDLKAQQRIQIMMSQIKPHFLYNSLAAIEELCDSDPKVAKETTGKFARYLRGNMDSMLRENEVAFERELSHTQLYLDIESIRFADALEVKYDITCTDFTIPPLTLEPLAENAVRHGVRKNPGGRGWVCVSTKEYPDHFEVSVRDNGKGFNPDSIVSDGHSHIGISNVRDRLQKICGGTLKIESQQGKGTTATIIIPKKSQL